MILLENIMLLLAFSGWSAVMVVGLFFKDKRTNLLALCALLIHILVLVFRIVVTGHLPFSGIYESLIFFSFLYGLKITAIRWKDDQLSSFLFIPALILLVIPLFMPASHKAPSSLMAALKSVWFYIHVPSIFVGYVSVTFAFVLSFFRSDRVQKIMENEIKQGFFFLSTGIITGAFWGAQTWTRFWNWDPKEVWALITWLLLCGALHIKNKTGRRILLYASFGALLFTYFGVTYILPGLHSYG